MIDAHRYIGYVVPVGFLLLTLWAAAGLVRNRAPGENFWRLLAVAQVVLGVQIVVGGILYIAGSRAQPNTGPEWLHYTYGALFPLFLLVVGHRFAGTERFQSIPWVVFGIVALLNFGLTFQALRTGLGIDL